MDKVKYWLRWLAVLPASILAGFLVTIPLHLILYQTLTGSGIVEPSARRELSDRDRR